MFSFYMYYMSTTGEITPIFEEQLFHVKLGFRATYFMAILYSSDLLKIHKNPKAQNNTEYREFG